MDTTSIGGSEPREGAIHRYPLIVVRGATNPAPEKGDDKTHSGRLLLRMPRALHGELARLAEKQGVSLNQLIVGLLSSSTQARGSTSNGGAETPVATDPGAQRRLSVALTVNLVVLAIAGVVAIVLLIVALDGAL
jgi:HicB family